MKGNLFLTTAALTLLLACGDDRNKDNVSTDTPSQKIIGTWTIVNKESNGINNIAALPCSALGSFVFSSDKKLQENYNTVVNNNCVTDTDSYMYSVDESNMRIIATNSQNDNVVYAISSLSDKVLILVNTEGTDTTKFTFNK